MRMNQGNEKIVTFFDHKRIGELVDLMTLMPGEESSHARGHRLPYVASEILATDNGTLIDKFFKSASAA